MFIMPISLFQQAMQAQQQHQSLSSRFNLPQAMNAAAAQAAAAQAAQSNFLFHQAAAGGIPAAALLPAPPPTTPLQVGFLQILPDLDF